MPMGVIRTQIAEEPPAKDHVGDVALTNRMLATLHEVRRDISGDSAKLD